MVRTLRRNRGALIAAGTLCVVAVVTVEGPTVIWAAGTLALVVGLTAQWLFTRAQRPPRDRDATAVVLAPPVTGRWMALNGPARKVPSHGTHSHAQTYAVDLLYNPEGTDATRAMRFGWVWPPMRRPRSYPGFGRPLVAPAAATVVEAVDGGRDHLCRTSLPGLALMSVEGFVRSLGRPRHLLGNHLVLDLGDGVYAVFAHLRRGSLRVAAGDRVAAGRPLAECGNSGNSSVPHLHFQLMDGPDVLTARGLPFAWRYADDDGAEHTGVPENLSHLTAAP